MHSKIVGGSTAARVIACPGSVALVQAAPPQAESKYAAEGTFLHAAITALLEDAERLPMTDEQRDNKIAPALELLDQVDPDRDMEFRTEVRVDFGDFLPGVFGSVDLLGKIGNRAIILDWKFGDGVVVEAEENKQLMFYAAAARRSAPSFFDNVDEVELVIIQPPMIKRWVTTRARISRFEDQLYAAVQEAKQPGAMLQTGDHCRWCTAKPTCPMMTGAADRAVKVKFDALDKQQISIYLQQADMLDGWIADLRELAQRALDNGQVIPGYKLVAKRGTRKWLDESKARAALIEAGLQDPDVTTLVSPAVAEKKLKRLPDGLTVSVSSGNTMAPDSDPRPAVLQLGQLLKKVL
jgi:hypothetical protein